MSTVPALEVRDIGKHFGGVEVLTGISFSVDSGRRLGLVGPNGAGKTTLFNVITGELRPDGGTIRLLGQDVTRASPQERVGLGLGRTYQITKTFPALTVRENLTLGMMGQGRRKYDAITRWRAHSDLEDAVDSLAERFALGRRLDVPAASLSHGEIRELEVAIALGADPQVLLLDEPAAGLSPAERADMSALIRSLPSSISLIMVEHDTDIVREVVDEVVVLHTGKVIFTGPVEAAAADETVREVYVGMA